MMLELVLISTMSWRVTSYRSVPQQTDSTPFNTSTGVRTSTAVCAISPDELGKKIHYGDYLFVEIPEKPELSRYCWVEDVMNKRMRHSIDFWVATKAEEHKVGVRRGRVYRLPSPGEVMNPISKRKVPLELVPQVCRTYGDLLLRNPSGDEVLLWNHAADLVWHIQKADTYIFIQRLFHIRSER